MHSLSRLLRFWQPAWLRCTISSQLAQFLFFHFCSFLPGYIWATHFPFALSLFSRICGGFVTGGGEGSETVTEREGKQQITVSMPASPGLQG